MESVIVRASGDGGNPDDMDCRRHRSGRSVGRSRNVLVRLGWLLYSRLSSIMNHANNMMLKHATVGVVYLFTVGLMALQGGSGRCLQLSGRSVESVRRTMLLGARRGPPAGKPACVVAVHESIDGGCPDTGGWPAPAMSWSWCGA